jgi:hypothetical protein
MRNILTAEEERSAARAVSLTTSETEGMSRISPASPSVSLSTVEYFLMYPDNVVNEPYWGSYHVKIEETMITVSIINGVAKTVDKRVRDALEKAGFIFMYDKEIKQ